MIRRIPAWSTTTPKVAKTKKKRKGKRLGIDGGQKMFTRTVADGGGRRSVRRQRRNGAPSHG